MVNGWTELELLSLSDGGMQNGVFYEVSRKGSGIPLINVGDMYAQVPITCEQLELFDATDDEIKRFAVNDGDLFFTRSSVVPSGIAFCNWYRKTSNKPVVFDSHVIRFKTDTNKVVPMFLYLQCVSPKARRFFIANAKTATMTTIDQTMMGKCPIDIPPLPEQRRIAQVISDTDVLIFALEKLIAKKRAVKQGTMQELLTGKRRLPGFDGEWVEKSLGELFDFFGGFSASRAQLSNDGYPYLHYGDIHGTNRTYVDVCSDVSIPKLSISLTKLSNTALLQNGDVVFVDASEDDEGASRHVVVRNIDGKPFISGLHTIIARSKMNELDNLFKEFCFQTENIRTQFKYYAVGTKVTGVNKVSIAKINLFYPVSKNEQSAIAGILSDMNSEIEALTAKLNKAKYIKQGMMQELLTGRIRLIEEKADNGEN